VRSAAEFAVAAGVLTLIPGPDTLLTVRTALPADRRTAVAAAAGISTAVLGIFYLALLPQFIPAGADVLRWSVCWRAFTRPRAWPG
jgi:threonine/homoserine/homoserine lactone efflux protein